VAAGAQASTPPTIRTSLVIQGATLDAHTRASLQHVLDGEDAVTLPRETQLRAAKMLEEEP
jgi:hypothetical protein